MSTKTTVIIDLTKHEGCYSRPLSENIETIYQYAHDSYTTRDELVEWVEELIKPAYFNKDAKPRFIHRLRQCQTREAVLQHCLRAISNGVEYIAVA